MMMSACNCNPFMKEWTLEGGYPPFDKIRVSDYVPAVKEGIKQQAAEVDAIVANAEAPTFENTVAAYELSGKLLAKTLGVLYNVSESDATPQMQEVMDEVTPLVTAASEFLTKFVFTEDVYDQGVVWQIDNFQAILPGTHSKHARMQQRQIVDFSTYMTGELFQVMISHSLLGRGLPDAAADDSAFLLGVEASRRHAALSQLLFSTRTLRLSRELSAESVSDYLSGLLIGLEFSTDNISPVWLVGSAALTRRYQMAANAFGIQTRCVEGDRCFIAGMQSLQQRLTEKRYG